jgi:hypothetical protein
MPLFNTNRMVHDTRSDLRAVRHPLSRSVQTAYAARRLEGADCKDHGVRAKVDSNAESIAVGTIQAAPLALGKPRDAEVQPDGPD